MDELKCRICESVVRGQLDASPFFQGILLKMLQKLDKDRRGVAMCGRPLAVGALEDQLITDSAFQFALAGKNRELAVELGQRVRPPSLPIETLPSLSLPNPMLALCASRSQNLEENLQLVHNRFVLAEGQQERRLVCSVDHTYLQKQLCQAKICNQAGLVGAAWQPGEDEEECFLRFSGMSAKKAKTPAAPLMLECCVWNPTEHIQRVFSIASMPMALKPKVDESAGKPRNHGKRVACLRKFASGFCFALHSVVVSYGCFALHSVVLRCIPSGFCGHAFLRGWAM